MMRPKSGHFNATSSKCFYQPTFSTQPLLQIATVIQAFIKINESHSVILDVHEEQVWMRIIAETASLSTHSLQDLDQPAFLNHLFKSLCELGISLLANATIAQSDKTAPVIPMLGASSTRPVKTLVENISHLQVIFIGIQLAEETNTEERSLEVFKHREPQWLFKGTLEADSDRTPHLDAFGH